MNRALLAELQQQRTYPSITILANTTPQRGFDPEQRTALRHLIDRAAMRLDGDVDRDLAGRLVAQLRSLAEQAEQAASEESSRAVALCVSPQHTDLVRLGRPVEPRVIIDDTFATRDMVADVNRTARYRLVTVSEQRIRVLIGDRTRLVEVRNDTWPRQRDSESTAAWRRDTAALLLAEHSADPLPTLVAGVDRTVRRSLPLDQLDTIGYLPGNHDRSSWADLHNAAWPVVYDWLRGDANRALQAISDARSARRFAGGINEIWSLARDGRIDTLVVEEGYAVAVRIVGDHLDPADDPEAPDVIDDIVDDVIEDVLRNNGRTIIVPDGHLAAYDRIAAVLRF